MFSAENIMRILLTIVFCLFIIVNFSQSNAPTFAESPETQQQQGVNRFEGYNIFLDAVDVHIPQGGACATRYVPPATQITITDLNPATPMRLGSCSGSPAVRSASATTATVNADENNYKWCFTGEDKTYQLSFQADRFAGKITYNWIANPDASTAGFYNIRDFGAKGDGQTDDTIAIRSALAFIASRGGGGTLRFPEGDYTVGKVPNYKGITLPPGVTIEGVGSILTGAAINNVNQRSPSRISLAPGVTNAAIFRIGECTERVAIRDIELFANSQDKTYGIEAVGTNLTSQDFFIERVTFNKFYRGFYAHAIHAPGTAWQFDFIKVRDSRFLYNTDAGIWVDIWNTDWKIEGSFFQAPAKTATNRADGIYIYRAGMVSIAETFSGVPGGAGAGVKGGDFLHIIENGNLTIIGSQTEGMTRSLVFGELQGAGNLSYPITLINNIFGEPIEIKGRRMLVSTGNLYSAGSVRLNNDVEVYSTGDRFCYDGYILGCQTAGNQSNFIGGKIMFATGQPTNQTVPGRPMVLGSEVQMPTFRSNELPRNSNNGTMLFCADCRRNSQCAGGGQGAPAMFINGRWECL
jgi:hypothetical protein